MPRSSTEGFDRIRRFFEALVAGAGRPLIERVGSVTRAQTDRRFDSKRDPDNRPWQAWSPAYAATRPPGASLLIDTGALRERIEARIAGERVELEARTPYAGHVQVRRAFFGLGRPDVAELEAAIEAHFREAFRAA